MGCQTPQRNPQNSWVHSHLPPRRDSFPAFDVIHLGKCSKMILQEPKDQDTVPTLNLGMHMMHMTILYLQIESKTRIAELSVGMCFF